MWCELAGAIASSGVVIETEYRSDNQDLAMAAASHETQYGDSPVQISPYHYGEYGFVLGNS